MNATALDGAQTLAVKVGGEFEVCGQQLMVVKYSIYYTD